MGARKIYEAKCTSFKVICGVGKSKSKNEINKQVI